MDQAEPLAVDPSGLAAADPVAADQPDPLAWEEIENGRFRPRRIRGSCRGMELG